MQQNFFCCPNKTFCFSNQNLIDIAKCFVGRTKEFCCINTNKIFLLIWQNCFLSEGKRMVPLVNPLKTTDCLFFFRNCLAFNVHCWNLEHWLSSTNIHRHVENTEMWLYIMSRKNIIYLSSIRLACKFNSAKAFCKLDLRYCNENVERSRMYIAT